MDSGLKNTKECPPLKKLIPILLVFAVIFTSNALLAQTSDSAPGPGHRVGLIDMAHVFQKYKKFESLRNNLQADPPAVGD